jgi:hypothetical protein
VTHFEVPPPEPAESDLLEVFVGGRVIRCQASERAPLSGLHFVQVSLLRMLVRANRAAASLQGDCEVQTQVERVFFKTAEWLGKTILE